MNSQEIKIIEDAYNAENENERIVGIDCNGYVVDQDAEFTVDWVHAKNFKSLERFKSVVESRAETVANY